MKIQTGKTMSPEESISLLENSKKGQRLDLLIKVPARNNKTYEVSLKYLQDLLEDINTDWSILDTTKTEIEQRQHDLWQAVSGIVFFGSAVGARYHDLISRKFFIFKKTERVLIYDRGREPNDLDILFILDDEEVKRQNIHLEEKPPEAVFDAPVSFLYKSEYTGWTKRTNIAKGELDLIFTSESQLKKYLQQGMPIAHHIKDAGVLALGTCPIELRSTNFFKATRKELSLQFAVA